MATRNPTTRLATHQVTNQPPSLEGYNAFDQHAAPREASIREGAPWGEGRLRALGRQPEFLDVFLAEVNQARGLDARLDASIDALKALATKFGQDESAARRVTESMAVSLRKDNN